VTPASIMDNTPILDLVDWVLARWKITPKRATGDAKYGTVPNIVGLEERCIKAYLPTSDFSKRTKYYPAKLFQYVPENDQYVCPQGQILPLVTRRRTEQVFVYKLKADVCNACPRMVVDFCSMIFVSVLYQTLSGSLVPSSIKRSISSTLILVPSGNCANRI